MSLAPPVYLDNAATTPLWPEVAQWLAAPQLFGNPSSGHAAGREARKLLDKARSWVAQELDVDPSWVVFTASATESDNLAILGSARALLTQRAKEGNSSPLHLVTSAWEHPAVLAPMQALAAQGHELCIVEPDEKGKLSAEAILSKVRPDTALLSLMAVHNELGLIFPVQELASKLADHGARLHCDGVQAIATQALSPKKDRIDLLTLTAHKIGGPKGVGVLVRDPALAIEPLCVGGGQESGLRPGTENPTMAFAFALALRQVCEQRDSLKARFESLAGELVAELHKIFPGMQALRELAPCVGNIVTVCIPGRKGAQLVQALDARGICASAGSACHSGQSGVPSAAQRMGIAPEVAQGMLRLSLGPLTERSDIESTITALREISGSSPA